MKLNLIVVLIMIITGIFFWLTMMTNIRRETCEAHKMSSPSQPNFFHTDEPRIEPLATYLDKVSYYLDQFTVALSLSLIRPNMYSRGGGSGGTQGGHSPPQFSTKLIL
ncbi:hypothetical protein QL285_011994 [Trifolium repens]|nr:hypothetical protein QL285_011994 [Trifolium repens]